MEDTPMALDTATMSVAQTLPRVQRCDATIGRTAADFGFLPVACRQTVGVREFITTSGLAVGYCALDGHEASVRRRFAERVAPVRKARVRGCPTCADANRRGAMAPIHDPSPRCESGGHAHCTCSDCGWD
jgi:hypothetical protein